LWTLADEIGGALPSAHGGSRTDRYLTRQKPIMEEYPTTTPKPFVFVLMPFAKEFDDIYKYGIKGAAKDVGAHAERVDEQLFHEGILDRVFNQISKADVIVADMTDRNPNVFYEVGYAHALGKIVLLVTQDADDIPFDLQNRLHVIYQGSIDTLRKELGRRLSWALDEARKRSAGSAAQAFIVSVEGQILPHGGSGGSTPLINCKRRKGPLGEYATLNVSVRNASGAPSLPIDYVYVIAEPHSEVVPCELRLKELGGTPMGEPVSLRPIPGVEELDPHKGVALYRVGFRIPRLPPGAAEQCDLHLCSAPRATGLLSATLTLRLHGQTSVHDFPFRVLLE